MYSVTDDVVKLLVIATIAIVGWWLLTDPDGTVGGVEID